MQSYTHRIGIAGTHGKSTTTSMIAQILIACGKDPTVVSGASLPSMGGAYRIGGKEFFVFEACEYKDSFLQFAPTVAITLNAEMEHVDYFHSKEQMIDSYRRWMAMAETAVVGFDSPWAAEAADGFPGRMISFGLASSGAAWSAENIRYEEGSGCGRFTLTHNSKPLCDVRLAVAGRHCIYDAVAALAVCIECCELRPERAAAALAGFTGASRRFEARGKALCGADIYDDYAHHPTEVAATFDAALCGSGTLWCVFQSHTYSRTAELFDRFVSVFSNAADHGVHVIFTDIYSAGREENTYGVHAQQLADAVPGAVYLPRGDGFGDIASYLNAHAGPDDRILVMGAGDVTLLCEKLKRAD